MLGEVCFKHFDKQSFNHYKCLSKTDTYHFLNSRTSVVDQGVFYNLQLMVDETQIFKVGNVLQLHLALICNFGNKWETSLEIKIYLQNLEETLLLTE